MLYVVIGMQARNESKWETEIEREREKKGERKSVSEWVSAESQKYTRILHTNTDIRFCVHSMDAYTVYIVQQFVHIGVYAYLCFIPLAIENIHINRRIEVGCTIQNIQHTRRSYIYYA